MRQREITSVERPAALKWIALGFVLIAGLVASLVYLYLTR